MKLIVSSCMIIALSSPALSAECRSIEGQVLSEPISVERTIEWNGLQETLEMKGAVVKGGKLDGQKLKKLSLPCKADGSKIVCEQMRTRLYRAAVEGTTVIETVILDTGSEVMRVTYACDKPPIPGK